MREGGREKGEREEGEGGGRRVTYSTTGTNRRRGNLKIDPKPLHIVHDGSTIDRRTHVGKRPYCT